MSIVSLERLCLASESTWIALCQKKMRASYNTNGSSGYSSSERTGSVLPEAASTNNNNNDQSTTESVESTASHPTTPPFLSNVLQHFMEWNTPPSSSPSQEDFPLSPPSSSPSSERNFTTTTNSNTRPRLHEVILQRRPATNFVRRLENNWDAVNTTSGPVCLVVPLYLPTRFAVS